MEWNLVNAHPTGTPAPVLEKGELTLSGRAVQSRGTYTAPVTIECGLQPQPATTNSAFYIDLVPAGQPATALPGDSWSIKLIHGQTLQVWATHGSQPTPLIEPVPLRAAAEGGYKLAVDVRRDGLEVRVNGETVKVDKAMPFDEFHIELRSFPPPNSWRASNFSVH